MLRDAELWIEFQERDTFIRIMSRTRFPKLLVAGLVLTLAWNCPAAEEPLNLSRAKEAIATYVESGDYGKAIVDVAMEANKYLIKRATKGAKKGEKMAVIFDIDETTLTNLPHMQEMDFGYVPRIWDEWVAEGQARAIIPVQTVYDTAMRMNVDVIFITGRKPSDAPGTERNLRQVGYEKWARIYYKPADFKEPTRAFKIDMRRKLAAEGYVIIANLGDQQSDLVGGYAEKTFKLPNPFYLIK
jgi:predicted secreted acid phosphatase